MAGTEYVQWDTVSKSSGSGNDEYLRLESGNTYRIRPIFSPVKFFKYFHKKEGRLRTAICGNPDTCAVRDRHSELKKPSMRFAAYIIDRADGKVKVLEAPQSVFRPIGGSFEATGKNPGGGKDGSDWQIRVSGKGLNTTYDVVFIENTPLTNDERNAIKESLDGDKQKLKKMYKVDTPDEIEEKLFGSLEKKESKGSENVSESTSNNADFIDDSDDSSSENDDFDSNW